MKKLIFVLATVSWTAVAQHDHTSEVRGRGAHVMGFSLESTTHHFTLTFDGGVIDVRANDASDTQSRDAIRLHFRHVGRRFANGDFADPTLVHATNVPGTAAMAELKDKLHWDLVETPRGAKMVITTDNKPALDAVHDFLRFQIEDHKTGDCEIPH